MDAERSQAECRPATAANLATAKANTRQYMIVIPTLGNWGNLRFRRAMNEWIPETSTQVKANINIDHQRRRPHILGGKPARGVVTSQMLIVLRKIRVRVGDGHQLIRSKSWINQDLGIEQAATGLGVVSVARAVADGRAARLVPRGQLDAAGAGVVAEGGELVAVTAADAGAVEGGHGVVDGGAGVPVGEAAGGVGRVGALRVEVEKESSIDQEVGDCLMGLAFYLSFTVGVTGQLSCLESHPELWNVQKRRERRKDGEIVEEGEKRRRKKKINIQQPRLTKLSDPQALISAATDPRKPCASTATLSRPVAAAKAWPTRSRMLRYVKRGRQKTVKLMKKEGEKAI